ncbi:MAG: Holliday junction resolvase RuvX [Aeriscardovia sp.]|nr:Holliday junction resolvase RuvX [Aeriscardovia sp.]
MKCMGVDLGKRRIGLALGESESLMAWPLRTVEAGGDPFFALDEVSEIAIEEGVGLVAVGLPINMDGSFGPSARAALRWKEAFEKMVPCRVETADERLTTLSAHRELESMGMRANRHMRVVDQLSAVMILQSAMERERGRKSAGSGQ